MNKYFFFLFLCAITISACGPKPQASVNIKDDAALKKLADELAHKYIITDGHVDLPYRLRVKNFKLTKEFTGIPISTDEGDFDYERSKEGGLDAPFMSIYIPASYQKDGGAKELADSLIDMVNGIITMHPDKFATGRSTQEVKKAFEDGKIALPMGMENGAPIGDKLQNVSYFHKRGIRYITLTHSKDNLICDSSYDTTGTWGGLSPFGKKVVVEMNRVGIMVDISHVSDKAFYQVMSMTKVPCIASHSSVRKFTPGFERNMNDDMIRKLADNNGVIQINFGSTFLDGKLRTDRDKTRIMVNEKLKAAGIKKGSDEAKEFNLKFRKENPQFFYADVELVADHIEHVANLVGVEHVGFGSDYDGVGDSLPTGLKDVSAYPNLIYVLLKRGFSEEDIEKMCYKNVFRVWSEVEQFAKASRGNGKPKGKAKPGRIKSETH